MPMEATTVRGVRLKYAAEDALELANDLATAGMFRCAELARAIALDCMTERDREDGRDAAAPAPCSLRV